MPGLTFRPQALAKLTSPEQLDQLIRVTTLPGWLALAGLACLLAPLLAWGVWGSLETRLAAQGVLLPVGGLCLVSAPQDGLVDQAHTWLGEQIEPGQMVMTLRSAQTGALQEVVSRCGGVVMDLPVQAGQPVEHGQELLMVEPAGPVLEAVVYVPLEQAYSLAPGMAARFAPAGTQAAGNGYLLGEVRWVGQYPVDPQALGQSLGSQSLAQVFLQSGPLVEVHINLTDLAGQYHWSLAHSAGRPLHSGTLGEVSILLDRRAPVELVFPQLNQ
ncbi:MAG: HlyD family efflux transporter periplasmic adaptor subunit [Chloroflexota bacterium]